MGTKTSIWSFDGEIIELNGACSHVWLVEGIKYIFISARDPNVCEQSKPRPQKFTGLGY
jgi:hypothetical protein